MPTDPKTAEPIGTREAALSALARVLGVESGEITGMRKVADTDRGPEFSYSHNRKRLRVRPERHWVLGGRRGYEVWDGDHVIRSLDA